MTTVESEPTPLTVRALGPDLARGMMLLFIALANSHYFLRGQEYLGGFPLDGSATDRAVSWLIATFVDGRAFPMFGLLFGYGVAHLVRRNAASGRPTVRRLPWRRSAVLIVVGVIDGLLFYAGDILAMYGILLLVGAWAVCWRDGWLVAVAGLLFVVTSLPSPGAFSTAGPDGALLPVDLASMVTDRGAAVLIVALLGPLGFACPFLIGLWSGRRRVLEQPELHRALLTMTAVVGVGAAVLGAQPVALPIAGWQILKRVRATEAGRYQLDKAKLRTPVFGPLFHKIAMSRFARNLSTLLRAGVPILQALEIPYRVVVMCGGDLGASAAKKVDNEAWLPGARRYLELTSATNATDYQARRLKVRFKGAEGTRLVHTLNGTACAVGRTLVALLENFQRGDGSVGIPEALQPYTGFKEIRPQEP
jgi:hypothetical protein